MPVLLVLGACSGIAEAACRHFAGAGWQLILAGRNADALEAAAVPLKAAGADVSCMRFDALDSHEVHAEFWNALPLRPDAVLCAVGLLGDQQAARHDMDFAERVLRCNFTGLVPVLSMAADEFERRNGGSIIVISSVAGDRGRASNYVYGSAKAGMTAFLQGLRQRLGRTGVHVMTVKPGYVATAMTAHRRLPGLITATADEAGLAIYRAFLRRREVVYVKWYWRPILWACVHVPECLFKLMRF